MKMHDAPLAPDALPAARAAASLLAGLGRSDLPLARAHLAQRLRAEGVSDDVVEAFAALPRHAFAPPWRWPVAYAELALAVGEAWLLRPSTLARALDALPRGRGRTLLEIGTGTGYPTALLLLLGARVVSVDPSASCLAAARTRLVAMQSDGWTLHQADAGADVDAAADLGTGYDGMLFQAALPRLPVAWVAQGRAEVVVAPVCLADGSQRLVRLVRQQGAAGGVQAIDLGPCAFPLHASTRHAAHRLPDPAHGSNAC